MNIWKELKSPITIEFVFVGLDCFLVQYSKKCHLCLHSSYWQLRKDMSEYRQISEGVPISLVNYILVDR